MDSPPGPPQFGHDGPMPGPVAAIGPLLRPGALLLRRGTGTLQIGTAPGVRVPDRPGLVRVLRLLDGAVPMDALARTVARDIPEFVDDLPQTLARLSAAGAVVMPSAPPRATRVAVRPDRSCRAFAALLAARFPPSPAPADLEVVVSAGEPPRSGFDLLAHAGVPYLPVVFDESRARIGPLVIPGTTPCLGCLDARRAADDPAWSVLVPQFERRRLLPIAASPALLWATAAELAAQIDHLDADRTPASVGQVLVLGPGHRDLVVEPVPFAVSCACRLLAA